MTDPIGIGIIGLGMGRHVLHVNEDDGSRFVVRGICDLDMEKLRDCAAAHEIGFVTSDHSELLQRDDIQLIGVYSPDHLHCEHILAALAAGKHVIVTKPMVNTMEEAERVIAAIRESGKKLLVAQTQRFRPEHLAVQELLASGKLGDLIFVQTGYVHDMRPVLATPGRDWRRDPSKKDWLVGAACHAIDLALWYGGEVAEVSAHANSGGVLEGREGHNNFVINLVFENGAIGRALALFSVVRPPRELDVLGVCGTLGSVAGTRVSMDGPDGVTESDLPLEEGLTKGHGGETARILRHMEDCIVNGEEPMIDAVQAAKTLAVAVAAQESIESGRSVRPRTVRGL